MSRFKPRRVTASTVVGALAAGFLFGVLPPTPAFAEGACTTKEDDDIEVEYTEKTSDDLVDQMPWPQSQLGTERLGSVATGKGVKVAVLDSGVDGDHPLLEGKVDKGTAYVDVEGEEAKGGAANVDCHGHGTAVASIIAADSAKDFGFAGLAPGVTILPERISVSADDAKQKNEDEDAAKDEPLTPGDFADAITEAVNADAKVINMSLKYTFPDDAIEAAVKNALDNDVTLVAAAGNGGCELDPETNKYKNSEPTDVWPASYDGVIGVGAVDKNIFALSDSQCGDWVDVVAPGVELIAARPGGQYINEFGATSGASAFVSATAALLYELHPKWSSAQIRDQILATASPVTGAKGDIRYGHGLIDPYRAITETRMDREPSVMPNMDPPSLNAESVAKQADFAAMKTWALWLGLGAVAVFVATLVGVGALRRGRKAGWSIRRVNKETQLEPFDDGDPIPLYQGIKGLKQ